MPKQDDMQWHLQSVREDNEMCISFVHDSLVFSFDVFQLKSLRKIQTQAANFGDILNMWIWPSHVSEMRLYGQKQEVRVGTVHSSSISYQLC